MLSKIGISINTEGLMFLDVFALLFTTENVLV